MENLKRYDFVPCSCVYETSGMAEEENGEYVKFSDIKDILKSTHNKQSEEIKCGKCGKVLPPMAQGEGDPCPTGYLCRKCFGIVGFLWNT